MRPRVDVPDGLVTSGTDARSAVVSRRRPASGESGGSTTISSCSVSRLLTSPGSATGSSVSPISERPLRTSVATAAASSGWSTRTTTSGWAWRNAPTRVASGSTASVGSATRSSVPAVSPPTAATDVRRTPRSRSTCRAGSRNASPADDRSARRPDPVEQLEAQLGLETADPLATAPVA